MSALYKLLKIDPKLSFRNTIGNCSASGNNPHVPIHSSRNSSQGVAQHLDYYRTIDYFGGRSIHCDYGVGCPFDVPTKQQKSEKNYLSIAR